MSEAYRFPNGDLYIPVTLREGEVWGDGMRRVTPQQELFHHWEQYFLESGKVPKEVTEDGHIPDESDEEAPVDYHKSAPRSWLGGKALTGTRRDRLGRDHYYLNGQKTTREQLDQNEKMNRSLLAAFEAGQRSVGKEPEQPKEPDVVIITPTEQVEVPVPVDVDKEQPKPPRVKPSPFA